MCIINLEVAAHDSFIITPRHQRHLPALSRTNNYQTQLLLLMLPVH